MGRLLVAVLATLAAIGVAAAPTAATTPSAPTLAPTGTVVDGPSSDIVRLTGMAVARDGTGGLLYLKTVGGVAHVFISSLLNGTFQAPHEIDSGLVGPSSQPVIAGTYGGQQVVAFVNGDMLYTAIDQNALTAWQPPQPLAAGATNPSLSMSPFGRAYLAFTTPGAGGHEVDVAYYYAGQWARATGPMDVNPGDDAGSGTNRPRVAAAGDGTGIVTWGEAGHVYVRRILYTSPSVAYLQADPASWGGVPEAAADDPVIGADGDSSYGSVAFRETLTDGQTRVLFIRLHAGRLDDLRAADGLSTPGSGSADQPGTGPTEFGVGLVLAEQTTGDNLYATRTSQGDVPGITAQVNTLTQASPPDAVTTPTSKLSTLIAWQQDQGGGAAPDIRLRYAPDAVDLNPEQLISSPYLGPTDADLGLFAGGDYAGDAVAAWVQGTGPETRIVAAQLYQFPGDFTPLTRFQYEKTTNPVIAWSPAAEMWGPIVYRVTVDHVPVGATNATAFRIPVAVGQGRRSWQVTAVGQSGLITPAGSSTVFVDSLAPTVSVRVTGVRHLHVSLRATVRASDPHPGLPASVASGVASIQVKWGDGAKPSVKSSSRHAYGRRGVYTLTVIVRDRAGNRTVVTRKLTITPKPRPKPKKKRTGKHHTRRRVRR